MKRHIFLILALVLVLSAVSCRKNPHSIIQIPDDVEYVGAYLETTDVLRIGEALNTAPTRKTIQWENASTGYQYSMMVFSTTTTPETDTEPARATRAFTVLTIAPSRDAEALNLIGTSSVKNTWNIVAETPAAAVGKVVRMQLTASPEATASLSSGDNFIGFMVQ